jgi:uncharacterized DUF497 family protein
MEFEWDLEKAASNYRKHRVTFELAQEVWDDPLHVIVFDRMEAGEARWHVIGNVEAELLLLVVFAERADGTVVRIISARKATRHERRQYEEEA